MSKSTLPITGVVLFKHGMGYFTRYGKLTGDQEVVLEFKSSEMNDVLKSLVALDYSGGHISSISYDSEESLSDQLNQYSITVGDSLKSLLNQFQGATVSLKLDDGEEIQGSILGVSTSTVIEESVSRPSEILAVETEYGIQQADLQKIKLLKLEDETLRKDLHHLLEVLLSSKKKDLKRLSIFAKTGEKDPSEERDFMVAYATEAPLWKTSYRILVDVENEEGEDKKEVMLVQGWAHIDNTMREDWEDVKVALVAGSPLSFRHDLYKARYKVRPQVGEDTYYNSDLSLESMQPMLASFSTDGVGPSSRNRMVHKSAYYSQMNVAEESMNVETTTMEIGDLFHYQIDNPVTVRRGQSAAVPLLQQKFHGNKVLHYAVHSMTKNPKTAIYFRNNTGKTLEEGPVTVLEQGEYAGDCYLNTIHKADKQLLAFSVQLGVKIQIDDQKSKDLEAHTLVIKDGFLELKSFRIRTTTYKIENKTDKKHRLFLDHAHTRGWEYVETVEPYSREDTYTRFDLALEDGTQRFIVKERGEQSDRRGLLNIDDEHFELWIRGGLFSDEVASLLKDLQRQTAEIREVDNQISQCQTTISEAKTEEERCGKLRQEVRGDTSPTAIAMDSDYLNTMKECRDTVKEKTADLAILKEQKAFLVSKRKDFIATIEFSTDLVTK